MEEDCWSSPSLLISECVRANLSNRDVSYWGQASPSFLQNQSAHDDDDENDYYDHSNDDDDNDDDTENCDDKDCEIFRYFYDFCSFVIMLILDAKLKWNLKYLGIERKELKLRSIKLKLTLKCKM